MDATDDGSRSAEDGNLQKRRRVFGIGDGASGGEDDAPNPPAVLLSKSLDLLAFDLLLEIIRFYGITLFFRLCNSMKHVRHRAAELIPSLALDGELGEQGEEEERLWRAAEVVLGFDVSLFSSLESGPFTPARPEGVRLAATVRTRRLLPPDFLGGNLLDEPMMDADDEAFQAAPPALVFSRSSPDWNNIDKFLVRGFYGYFRRDVCRTLFLLCRSASFHSIEKRVIEVPGGTRMAALQVASGVFDIWRFLPRRPSLDFLYFDQVDSFLGFTVPPVSSAKLNDELRHHFDSLAEADSAGGKSLEVSIDMSAVPRLRVGKLAMGQALPQAHVEVHNDADAGEAVSLALPMLMLLECRSILLAEVSSSLSARTLTCGSKNSLKALVLKGTALPISDLDHLVSCPALQKLWHRTAEPMTSNSPSPVALPDDVIRRLKKFTATTLGVLPGAFGLFRNIRVLALRPTGFSSPEALWNSISVVLQIGRIRTLSLGDPPGQDADSSLFIAPTPLPENTSLLTLNLVFCPPDGIPNVLSSLQSCQGVRSISVCVSNWEAPLDGLRMFGHLDDLFIRLSSVEAFAPPDRFVEFLRGLGSVGIASIRTEEQWSSILPATRYVNRLHLHLWRSLRWTIPRALEAIASGEEREILRLLSTMETHLLDFSGPRVEAVRSNVEPAFRRSSLVALHLKWRCLMELFPPVFRQCRLDLFRGLQLQ